VAGDCKVKNTTPVAGLNAVGLLHGITVDVRASSVSVDYPGAYTIRVYDLRGALTFAKSCKGRQKCFLPKQGTSGAFYIQIHAADVTIVKKFFAL
jgi:hypothetical protein